MYKTATVPHINHDVENIRETESLNDRMFEKLKVDGIKKEISLNYKIVLLKKNFKSSLFKEKSERLVLKSYANSTIHTDEIINHLLVFLENLIRYPNRNAVINTVR